VVFFLLLCMLIGVRLAYAAEAAVPSDDPALEKRVTALASELRCLVCQNQSLADSNADLAVDLKNEIRQKLKQGQSEAQIVDFMVARYGDFVLYRPPVKATTVALWLGPLVLLLLGLHILYRRLKSMSSSAGTQLTTAERERAATLLAGNKEQ
jgi:cytochrome c-type biogenesis protein CcmH